MFLCVGIQKRIVSRHPGPVRFNTELKYDAFVEKCCHRHKSLPSKVRATKPIVKKYVLIEISCSRDQY